MIDFLQPEVWFFFFFSDFSILVNIFHLFFFFFFNVFLGMSKGVSWDKHEPGQSKMAE